MTLVDKLGGENQRLAARDSASLVRRKVRIRFRKEGPLRLIGHHDLIRCWDRLLRRAGLPVRFSHGFHPMPRISSPLALSLGIMGWDELIDIELDDGAIELAEIRHRLEAELVEGLALESIDWVRPGTRCDVVAVEYSCCVGPLLAGQLSETIETLRTASAIVTPRRRPGRAETMVDLRSWLIDLRLEDAELVFRVKVTPNGTVRPEEVLRALGIELVLDEGFPLTRRRVELAGEGRESDSVPTLEAKARE